MTQENLGPFLNRELSWLEFNARVLEEAKDGRNPLLERLRFLCIFHSNLDEFFMVRVASLIRRIEDEDTEPDPAGLSPERQLESVLARVRDLLQTVTNLYKKQLVPTLAKEGIRILRPDEFSPAQERFVDEYFEREVFPLLTPLAVDRAHPFPRLGGLSVNLAVLLETDADTELRLAILPIPARLPGLCRLPAETGADYCWLEDIIRPRVGRLFAGYRPRSIATFRVTRDAEMELDDEGYDDFLRMLQSELRKRQRGTPIRLEHEEGIAPELLALLQDGLVLEAARTITKRVPLDLRALLPLADLPGYDHLRWPPQVPRRPLRFLEDRSIFDIIRDGDVLFHHPYESFDPTVEFIQTAADDPQVLAIKQTLYRTSGKSSPLLKALRRAAEAGKLVTVLLELTARFDEEKNIGWARDLEDAGAHVIYGIAGLKVHAKIALVVRREPDGIRRYVHLGTGNYNEKTARLYTDLGLLTADEQTGTDASGFFNTITGYSEPPAFRRLVMAPNELRDKCKALIRREADRARSGQVSGILAKMNSLVDRSIIAELLAAGQAGVKIRLNVRGICCLRPGVPGISENIRVVSIVDRYLEHSRVFVFRNGGETEVYASSADWMPRNLDRRVELMFPILAEDCRNRVIESLEAQFSDNQKARFLGPDGNYTRVSPGRAEPLRVQEYLYHRLLEEEAKARSSPVRFVPIEARREG
jgi:polyphosphate kinase